MKHTARRLIILAVILTTNWSVASANWKEFMPVPYSNGAEIEGFASYDTDSRTSETRTGTKESSWTDTFFKEKLTLHSEGYIYHPRFTIYNISLSGSLKEENFMSSYNDSAGWKNASGIEYNANIFVLPEHPYNLHLFARRTSPVYQEKSAAHIETVDLSRGGLFQYRKKPYFFNMRYIENYRESVHNTSDVKTFGTNGTYFKEFKKDDLLSLTATYTHSNFSSSSRLDGSSDQYLLHNTIDMRPFILNSSLSMFNFNQKSANAGSLESNSIAWNERLGVKLPLNFLATLLYSHKNNKFLTGTGKTAPERRLNSTANDVGMEINHKLYKSLENTYIFRHDMRTSTSSDSEVTSNSLTTNYTKAIPWGRLMAGLNIGRSVSDTTGQIQVINESHHILVPDSFLINYQGADQATIRVYLKPKLPPSELVLLEEGTHYTVTPFGNTFEIAIIDLPPEYLILGAFDPDGNDFILSYTLNAETLTLQTDNFGYNISFYLLNNILNPFYMYHNMKSEVLSGSYSRTPDDYDSHTAGINFRMAPFRAMTEYQEVISNVNPYSRWKNELSYTNNFMDEIRVTATARHTVTNYPEGAKAGGGLGYDINTSSISASVIKRFPTKNLSLYAGGSYSITQGLTDMSGYSFASSLMWKVGKLVVSLGASASGSESASANASSERMHQYYHLNVKRELF